MPMALIIMTGVYFLFPALNFGLVMDNRIEDGRNLRRVAAEFSIGAAIPTEKNLGNGLSYGLSVHKRFTNKLGLEVFLGRDSLSLEWGFAGLEAGNLDYTTLLFSGYLFFPAKGRLLPYAFVGVGFYFYDYKPNDEPVIPEKGVVGRFALNFGVGVDYMISNRVALTAKARYNLAKTWVEDLPGTVPTGQVNSDEQDIIHIYTLTLSLGLKYYF
jgi:opacity protein-like surface antigen